MAAGLVRSGSMTRTSPPFSLEKNPSSNSSTLPSGSSGKVVVMKLLNSSLLLKAMFHIGGDSEGFVVYFYSLLCEMDLQKDGVLAVGITEIRETNEEVLLFRSDSAWTRLTRMYNSLFGHDYLHAVVGTFAALAQKKYIKKVDVSLCLDADADPADRERAQRQIHAVFTHFLDYLLGTAALIPKEILEVTQSIAATVGDKFGQRSGDIFLRGYFFLRFLCPSLATPAVAMQCDVTPAGHKLFILLSRILQASVNNQEFENANMRFANEIVRESQDQLSSFFSCLRKGSSEGVEAIEKASLRIRKEMKKYRSKCPKDDCGAQEIYSPDDTKGYFVTFFQRNAFTIRKKIKFESGFARGEDAPLVVSLSLANLKLLQSYFNKAADSAIGSPSGSPSSKIRESPHSRLRVSSPLAVDSSGLHSPRKHKSSPLITDEVTPSVHVVRNVKVSRDSSMRASKTNSSFEKEAMQAVSKSNSEVAQFYLKLGYE